MNINLDCTDCNTRWSCSLEADGPEFVPCLKHRKTPEFWKNIHEYRRVFTLAESEGLEIRIMFHIMMLELSHLIRPATFSAIANDALNEVRKGTREGKNAHENVL